MTASLPTADADLVAQSLIGSRDAFARIVARYQSLICSIGYSATGNLSQSEDLAQETFISAWRQLRGLRDPHSLRAWLCGIARNLAHNALRRDGREPAHAAEPIEAGLDAKTAEAPPQERAISDEEQAILWRSIEHIPQIYREPLVLFYREQQSIETVAAALGLSEDAVRQRLSRGRKLLQEQVAHFVEGALARSAPGAAFTLAVVAALPGMSTSAAAAAIGATAAKGSALAKWAGLAALINLVTGPLIGLASGYLGYRVALDAVHTPRERELSRRQTRSIILGAALFVPALTVFSLMGDFWSRHPLVFFATALVLPPAFAIWLVMIILRSIRETQALRDQERREHPELFAATTPLRQRAYSEYRSRTRLFGLPLVHIQFGAASSENGPARGWIAIGTGHSYGILFALGANACGGISVGAISTGIICVGSVSVGVISLGTFALGVFAFGSTAFGLYAMGPFAAAWNVAVGGIAVAHDLAAGGFALAAHANDAISNAWMLRHRVDRVFVGALASIAVLTLLPGSLYYFALRRRRRSR